MDHTSRQKKELPHIHSDQYSDTNVLDQDKVYKYHYSLRTTPDNREADKWLPI